MLRNGNWGGISVAAEVTYTHTFANGDFGKTTSAESYNATLSGVSWSVTSSGFGYFGTTNGQFQIGSKSDPCTTLELKSSAFAGTIKSVKLSARSGGTRTLSVSVDGTSYQCNGKNEVSLTTTLTEYTFTGNSSGEIVISLTSGTKALYLGTLTIVYDETSGGSTEPDKTATTTSFGEDVDNQTFDAYFGDAFEAKKATVTPAGAGSVTYSSDKPDVASVDAEGNITIGTVVGIATITASFAGNDEYIASSAKYYINVKDPNAPIFYESFDTNKGKGGNDGQWNGSIASNTLIPDNSGWTFENENGANECAKLGKSSDGKGTATTPSIELGAGVYNLTFKAGGWNTTSEKTTINVSISNGTLTYKGNTNATHTITMAKGAWTDYAMTISGATNSTTIKFEAINKDKNRFFLDEVKIIKAEATPTLAFSESTKTVYFGEENDFSAPTLTLKDADGNIVDGATYNYVSSNPEAITVDNSGNITFVTKNKPANVTITATYAGSVEAYNGMTASYKIKYVRNPALAYSNIKELKDYAIEDESVTLNLTDAQVVYANGKNVFVRDASGAICFYNLEISGLVQNAVLNGTIKGKFKVDYGMPKLTADGTNTNADNLNITAGEAAQPKDLTYGSFADYTCDLVKVSKGVVNVENSTVSLLNESVESAQFYDKFGFKYDAPFNSAVVDVTGIVIPYVANGSETVIEIAPIGKYDIVYNFSENYGTAENDGTVAVGAVSDAKVAIERTLSSEYWNTLCLPFSLTTDQVKAKFGEGTLITEFNDVEGSVMTFIKADSIEAGKPYLFKPANTVANPVFEGVVISGADAEMITGTTNGDYAFAGTYGTYEMKTNNTEVFITTSGNLSYPAAESNTMKGMRAYIMLPASSNAKAFSLNIGGESTGIESIDGGMLNGNATVYNLNGQKMSSDMNSLAKGLYIVNGKKMIVK